MKTQIVEYHLFELSPWDDSFLENFTPSRYLLAFKNPIDLAFYWYSSGPEEEEVSCDYDGSVYFGIYNPKFKFKKIDYITEDVLRKFIKKSGRKYYIGEEEQDFDLVAINIYRYEKNYILQILGIRTNIKAEEIATTSEFLTHKNEAVRLAAKRALES